MPKATLDEKMAAAGCGREISPGRGGGERRQTSRSLTPSANVPEQTGRGAGGLVNMHACTSMAELIRILRDRVCLLHTRKVHGERNGEGYGVLSGSTIVVAAPFGRSKHDSVDHDCLSFRSPDAHLRIPPASCLLHMPPRVSRAPPVGRTANNPSMRGLSSLPTTGSCNSTDIHVRTRSVDVGRDSPRTQSLSGCTPPAITAPSRAEHATRVRSGQH